MVDDLELENDPPNKHTVDNIDVDSDRFSLESKRKVENVFDLMMLGDTQNKTSGIKAKECDKSQARK